MVKTHSKCKPLFLLNRVLRLRYKPQDEQHLFFFKLSYVEVITKCLGLAKPEINFVGRITLPSFSFLPKTIRVVSTTTPHSCFTL